ncbi:hypothetical protein D3C77_711500 [compost metagenome]
MSTVSALALETVPASLLRLAALIARAPSLTRLPCALFRSPERLIARSFWLVRRPLFSSVLPLSVSPVSPDSRPLLRLMTSLTVSARLPPASM